MKKIFLILMFISLFNISSALDITKWNTINTSNALFNLYLEKNIKNSSVLKEVKSLVRYNYSYFLRGFIAQYDQQSSKFYSPLSISQAVMPTVFYKAYDLFKKVNNVRNPYNTNDKYLSKEENILKGYQNWDYKKYLGEINNTVFNDIRQWKLFNPKNGTVDPISLIKYNNTYQTLINNNRKNNYISTPVERNNQDYLKNIIGINNDTCNNYKDCARKSFIWNNGDNIPNNKMKNVDLTTFMNNNIRSLTLEQSNNFIWDFVMTNFMPVVNMKNSKKMYNRLNIFNKKSIELNQKVNDNTNVVKLYNKMINLKSLYNNVSNIVNRYYTSPKRVLTSLLWCSIYQDNKINKCNNITNEDRGKTDTLIVKKGSSKTTLLAFVSALDLPSVYLWKTNDNEYYPTKYENEVYKNWINDNIYTNNGLFSEDFARLINRNSAKNFMNWYSAIQWKYLVNSKDLFQTKQNRETVAEQSTITTVNATWNTQWSGIVKGFSINFFPTLTFTWFKIELDNNSSAIKLLSNPNSLYNKLLNELNSTYTASYKLWINNTLGEEYIMNENNMSLTWWVSTGDNHWQLHLNTTLFPWTIQWTMNPNIISNPSITKELYNQSNNSYNTIVNLHNILKKLIVKLDKRTSQLYNVFIKNPTTVNYKLFINQYAEQLIYSSLYNTVKKNYYPYVYTHNNHVLGWFEWLNWNNSTHSSFVSAISYHLNDLKDPLTKQLVNNYNNTLNSIEWTHYTKKEINLTNDWINNVSISWLIWSFNATPANKAEEKLSNTIKDIYTLSETSNTQKENQAKYNTRIHSIYSTIDYSKFIKFANVSDASYNQSSVLWKLANIMNNEWLWHIKNFYSLSAIYNFRTDLPNSYDVVNDYIFQSINK